jgi:hypothetical protein
MSLPANLLKNPSCPNIGPSPPIWNINHWVITAFSAAVFTPNLPDFSARYSKMAPDFQSPSGAPSGPSGSMIAGILLLGFSDKNASLFTSASDSVTRCGSYGRPISYSAIDTLTPLGVG